MTHHSTMLLGYNTNGLPHHRWQDALALIAETGFESVALTIDHHCLNPFEPHWLDEANRVADALSRHSLRCVVETGARFLLNPRIKHEPTLMSATPSERAVRVDFLKRCIDIAAVLDADAVSLWSGILRDDISRDTAMQRLVAGLKPVIDYAGEREIRLAFEPEPGMFIAQMADFRELESSLGGRRSEVGGQRSEVGDQRSEVGHQSPVANFGLTIDIGHLHCVETGDIAGYLHDCRDRIFNIHIEDMQRGVHEHLMFGEGEIDFVPVMAALKDIGYTGGVHVELSRHGHNAPRVMRESFRFLTEALRSVN